RGAGAVCCREAARGAGGGEDHASRAAGRTKGKGREGAAEERRCASDSTGEASPGPARIRTTDRHSGQARCERIGFAEPGKPATGSDSVAPRRLVETRCSAAVEGHRQAGRWCWPVGGAEEAANVGADVSPKRVRVRGTAGATPAGRTHSGVLRGRWRAT